MLCPLALSAVAKGRRCLAGCAPSAERCGDRTIGQTGHPRGKTAIQISWAWLVYDQNRARLSPGPCGHQRGTLKRISSALSSTASWFSKAAASEHQSASRYPRVHLWPGLQPSPPCAPCDPPCPSPLRLTLPLS